MRATDLLTPRVQAGHQACPGSVSQDRFIVLSGAVAVLDGASDPDEPEGRDGGWYADTLAVALTERLPGYGQDLSELLAETIDQVATEHQLRPGESPSATVTILRWGSSAQEVEGLALSDSVLVVREIGESVHVVTDGAVEQIAPRLREVMADRLAAGSGYDQEHAELLRQIRRHLHAVRNHPGGHWVAEADPEAAHHAQRFTLHADQIQDAVLLTDGASAAVDTYRLFPGWGELLETLKTSGPEALIERVRAIENEDPHGQQWPRAKPSDDATAVYLQFLR